MENPEFQYLLERKSELISEENFKEALKIETEIQELQEKERRKSLAQVQSKLKEEKSEMNLFFRKQTENVNQKWDNLIDSEKKKASRMIEDLSEKHTQLLNEERERASKLYIFKPSPKLLSIYKSKEFAIKHGDLFSAEKFKVMAEKQLKKESEAFDNYKNECIDRRIEALKRKTNRELAIAQEKQRFHVVKIEQLKGNNVEQLNKRFSAFKNRRQSTRNTGVSSISSSSSNRKGNDRNKSFECLSNS